MTNSPTITDADREAANRWLHPKASPRWHAKLTSSFALHRTQSVADKDVEIARLRGRIADMEHLLTGARNLLSRLPSDVFGHAYEDHVYIPRSSMSPHPWDIEAKPVSVRDHFLAEVHKALRHPKEQDDGE